MWAVAAFIVALTGSAVAGPEPGSRSRPTSMAPMSIWGPRSGSGTPRPGFQTFAGGTVSLTRLREGDLLGLVGGRIAAARWTERDAGRIDGDCGLGRAGWAC